MGPLTTNNLNGLLVLVLLFGLSAMGCGDDDDVEPDSGADADTDTDTDSDTDTDTDTDSDTSPADSHDVTVLLSVPATFDATPATINMAFLTEMTTDQMPAGIGAPAVETPDIGVDKPLSVTMAAMKMAVPPVDKLDPGDYYILISLMVEGGGQYQPVPGVDYIYMTTEAKTIGSGPVDLGAVEAWLFEE